VAEKDRGFGARSRDEGRLVPLARDVERKPDNPGVRHPASVQEQVTPMSAGT
jgi:hypothetical protein